jgi:hypothetical protein
MRSLNCASWFKQISRRAQVPVLLVMLAVYAALAFGIYNGLTVRLPGANDFFSRWMGARAFLVNGQNPYLEVVTDDIQRQMYGRLAAPGEDQVAYAYPFYALYLAAPLVTFPYTSAQALWMALLVFCVIASVLTLATVNRLTLDPLTLALILFGALFFYPSVRAIFLGQYAVVSFALIVFANIAIARNQDYAAGILLAWAAVKPQPVIFIIPVVLFWAWRNGRRRLVWSALTMLTVLIVSSFLLAPTWFTDFLNGLRAYVQYEPVGPPIEIFFNLLLPKTPAMLFTFATSAALFVWMLVTVWRNQSRNWFEFQLTLGFVALVTTLIAVRIGSSDQVFLLILWIAWLTQARIQNKYPLIALAVAYLLIVPWSIFLSTLQGNTEALVVGTILPFSTLLAYLVWSLVRVAQRRVV